MLILFNLGEQASSMDLPEGEWELYIHENKAGTEPIRTDIGRIEVAPCSAKVYVRLH